MNKSEAGYLGGLKTSLIALELRTHPVESFEKQLLKVFNRTSFLILTLGFSAQIEGVGVLQGVMFGNNRLFLKKTKTVPQVLGRKATGSHSLWLVNAAAALVKEVHQSRHNTAGKRQCLQTTLFGLRFEVNLELVNKR